MTDPTLRRDLISFLAEKGRVVLRTPDFRPMCGRRNRLTGIRCGADCVPGQGYCFECRQEYEANRNNPKLSVICFHDDTTQILRAYRFLRRQANREAA